MSKGIIFDFNGTMVFDSHIHEQAWVELIQKYNESVTPREVSDYIHGMTNDKIIRYFIGHVSEQEMKQLAHEKEKSYQNLVREEKLSLVEGTEKLLDELVKRDIPFTIATASPKINIDFYFDYFNLEYWFDREEIVYDDGSFPGKPDPTIYKMAAESLDLKPEECIVIEDASSGIQSSNRAGIEKIIIMANTNNEKYFFEKSELKYDTIIENFVNFINKVDFK